MQDKRILRDLIDIAKQIVTTLLQEVRNTRQKCLKHKLIAL